MHFQHSSKVWEQFPDLAAGVLAAAGLDAKADVTDRLAPFEDTARARLEGSSEGEFPEIRAWRRTFSAMGLKPTQYRCASESLLRRFRKEGSLPRIHPLIDLCNAVSIAYAIPIAVFDTAFIGDGLEVRPASGTESYLAFSGQTEHPEPGETVFADAADNAHARRWTNRQSARSATRDTTSTVLIVAEALHEAAAADVGKLIATVADELRAVWGAHGQQAVLSAAAPRFDF